MRLIDANSFIQRLEHEAYSRNRIELLRARDVVNETPTVDAVQVIRCKDCKFHCNRTRCKKRIGAWFDDDYCNGAVMAERKEE